MQEQGLNLLAQRVIEARLAARLVEAFAQELGRERALAVLRRSSQEQARQAGRELARRWKGGGLLQFSRVLDIWQEGGALELEILQRDGHHLRFNVTRCRYAEEYRRLGLDPELGYCLSCCRDAPLAQGFDPHIELLRSKTIMQGDGLCDFHFRLAPAGQ